MHTIPPDIVFRLITYFGREALFKMAKNVLVNRWIIKAVKAKYARSLVIARC